VKHWWESCGKTAIHLNRVALKKKRMTGVRSTLKNT